MLIAHLLASPFYGGPERQVLALARELPGSCSSIFLSFGEGGRAREFLAEAHAAGFEAIELRANWPHVLRVAREVAGELRSRQASILCTSGYKPDILGLPAARLAGIPAVAIAHGWTGATWKVRLNEALDRRLLRHFDAVVSVSQSQANAVRRARVAPDKIVTIPNTISPQGRYAATKWHRAGVEGLWPRPPRWLIGAAGRLSPEKGFEVLIDAAAILMAAHPETGVVIFGDGPLRSQLQHRIDRLHLDPHIVLAGHRQDLDQLLPNLDVLVIPSHTEGLPVILLEALRSGLPVVATSVGGIPEVLVDGEHGLLVPAGDKAALAAGISRLLQDEGLRAHLREAGPQRIAAEFSTPLQAQRYFALFTRLLSAAPVLDKTCR